MKIEFLRNYIKLNEYKSFSELAKNLYISQSTLSHQIFQLEKEFGDIKLINRTTRSFILTEEGKIVLDNAKKIVDLYDSCNQALEKFKENKTETAIITITASTLPGSHILPKFIANYKDRNPKIDFKIIINNSKKSIKLLEEERADFAGIGSFMDGNHDKFDYIKIGGDKLSFICSPSHKLLKKEKEHVNFEKLKEYPFINREKGSGTQNVIEKQFPQYNQLNLKLEINNNDSIISAVSESNYLSILSEIIAKKAEKAGLIKILEVKGIPEIGRDIFLIKKKGRIFSNLKQKFWDFMKS